MHRFLCRTFQLILIMSSLLGLLLGWHAPTHADPGKPILLVVNDSAPNKFNRYLGEILRAEGLNAFEVIQLSSLTATDLTGHSLTIL
ncbi:MAG TPA: hypothetical protein VEC93_15760, partial [Anaerolineae bacterium]|nr:hypothetical protein [Anaerolineae bacterium]